MKRRSGSCRLDTHPIVRRIHLQGAGVHRQVAGDGGAGERGGAACAEELIDCRLFGRAAGGH